MHVMRDGSYAGIAAGSRCRRCSA